MEIERKFLIKELPDNLEQYTCKCIEQGYLCKSPVVRIRRSNDKYILTYKAGRELNEQSKALECDEREMPLSKEAYEHLRNKIDGYVITKKRYIIPIENQLKVELDIFEGSLKGLVFAEVEFPDGESAAVFRKPDWFGADVSFDKRFRNSFLSTVRDFKELGLRL